MNHNSLSKIVVNLNPNDWHGYATETIWAEHIRNNLFKIRNVPFFAKDLGLEDVILVDSFEGNNYLRTVKERNGHSTYRLFLNEKITASVFREYWVPLENIGCSYEKGQGQLIAVDVPPKSDIYKAYHFLEIGEANNIWEFEEGYCGHPLDDN